MIELSKPFLPPKKLTNGFFDLIWNSHRLTNNGPLLQKFEDQLKDYFRIDNISVVSSGTMALQIAIKSLNLKKKIITTPFSYVATSTSIIWEGCKPVFADINSNTLNVDPRKIEELIDKDTQAILVTHCFGNACEIDEIIEIAKNNNLKLIFDSAHCFDVEYEGKSIFNYGDISILSLHSTKIFHMVEGGVLFTKNHQLKQKFDLLRNFGHNGPEKFEGIGVNGKNSEFHAAIGLANFEYIEEILKRRKMQVEYYDNILFKNSISLKKQELNNKMTKYNYSYYPLIFPDVKTTLKIQKVLLENKIISKRYFYPLINSLEYIKTEKNTPHSNKIGGKILCLPLHHYLKKSDQNKITKLILKAI